MDAHDSAIQQLARYYQRRGSYVRGPIPERLLREGWRRYKKGWELRLSLAPDELGEVRQLISRAGYYAAEPFGKSRKLIQPVYGRPVVDEVLAAAGESLED